jgi:hypothetical protein
MIFAYLNAKSMNLYCIQIVLQKLTPELNTVLGIFDDQILEIGKVSLVLMQLLDVDFSIH